MKNVFTLSLFALLTVSLSFAQGFEPPLGSTYNADSTEITLPSAYLEANYLESIIFDVPETFTIEIGSIDLPFNFAQITGVSILLTVCYIIVVLHNCYFEPNTSGGVVLCGFPTEIGNYELSLNALVSLNLESFLGLILDVTFSIPYIQGESVLLDFAFIYLVMRSNAINK